jgi:hypothetical protein
MDLSGKQVTLQTGVVADTQPQPWIPFGAIETDVDSSYGAGESASAVFWGAHPKNNLRTQGTFVEVQRKDGDTWTPIYTDREPCTVYQWRRDFIANSKITITWNIPADTKPGEYRLCHYGDAKDGSGKIQSYVGASSSFRVGADSSSRDIAFSNSYAEQVELWFYHQNDTLKWFAYSNYILKSKEKYTWHLPCGWDKVQVRFTGPGKWRTLSGGDSINITANGDIDNVV